MIERSRAYPGIDLEDAVKRVEQLNKRLGSSGQYTRDQIAKGVGYAGVNGRASRTIGALVHYGLLDRQKDKYSLSFLAKTILFPHESDGSDRQEAIRTAAHTPTLFAELIEEYKGKKLPELLGNILVDRGVAPKAKEEVVSLFKSSLNFAGLMHADIIQPSTVLAEPTDQPNAGLNEASLGVSKSATADLAPARPLPSGIVITFPGDLDPFVTLGEFGPAIKSLESIAKAIRGGQYETQDSD